MTSVFPQKKKKKKCDFCVYLKRIPYGYMISLKCGDEEENS